MRKPVPAPRRGPSRSRSGGRPKRSGLSGSGMPGAARGRAPPRDVASMFTTAGFSRSAMSANDAGSRPGRASAPMARSAAETSAWCADCAGAGVIEPATMSRSGTRPWPPGRPSRPGTAAPLRTLYRLQGSGYRDPGTGSRLRFWRSAPEMRPRPASARPASWPCRPCCPARRRRSRPSSSC